MYRRKKKEDRFNVKKLEDKGLFAINIINLSRFPVVITQVGYLFKNKQKNILPIITPILFDGGKFPRKLEARDAVTVYGQL